MGSSAAVLQNDQLQTTLLSPVSGWASKMTGLHLVLPGAGAIRGPGDACTACQIGLGPYGLPPLLHAQVGVLNDVLTNAENVVAKGRLGPGQMVVADLEVRTHCI